MKRTKYHPWGKQTIARDAHAPETVYIETVTNEGPVVERNKKIRSAELMRRGQRSPFMDGDELTASFQFPSAMEYQLCKAKYPDIFADLDQGGDIAIRAGERLSLLVPQFVTMVKRGDRL